MDAFVSHSSANTATARRAKRALNRAGLSAWLDETTLRPGELLRDQLSAAIRQAKVFVLVWSKEAQRSRWVAAELMTAFHADRPIIPCTCDKTSLPQFMQSLLSIDLSRSLLNWALLVRAVRQTTPERFRPIVITSQEPKLKESIANLAELQHIFGHCVVHRELNSAREAHDVVDEYLAKARRRWPFDAQLLNLAGYHCKNAYMLKHWQQIQAGYSPSDSILRRAERFFFQSLFLNPEDPSALNGLASVLILEHEFPAASFFNARAIQLADDAGLDYEAAKFDRTTIKRYLANRVAPARKS